MRRIGVNLAPRQCLENSLLLLPLYSHLFLWHATLSEDSGKEPSL